MKEKVIFSNDMKKKEILINNKQYNMWDFLRIPMSICPIITLIIGINRIITASIPAITVLVTADFVDTIIAVYNKETQYGSIFVPLILYMLIILYSYMNQTLIFGFVNIRYDMKIYKYFRSAIADKRAKLEYKHIENNDTWDLITRTSNDPLMKVALGMNGIFDVAEIVIRIGSVLVILMTQIWWIGLLILAITVPLLFMAIRGGKEMYDADKEAQKHSRRADYLHRVLSNRENIEERALFHYTDHINEKWHDRYEKSRKISLKTDMKWFINMKSASLLTIVISLTIIGVLLIPLSKNVITIGLFMGLVTATLDLVQMMSWRLSYVTNQIAKNTEYLKDLTTFMALSESKGALDEPEKADNMLFETLEFKGVSFKYPETEKYILKDFSLVMVKNLHYAFVGINGAGKTTITKLLTGMYDNYEGDIFINGKNLREYRLAQLKSMFSVVYQDFAKYFISMKDNIAIGNVLEMKERKQNTQQILETIHLMGLEDAVEGLSNGIDTPLGKISENGMDLSGGQWQKLAVARTLYNPAQVRILDEPTAALDPVAESELYEMFGRISAGKTTVFITHRLGAAKLADEIIVVDEGRVAEKGNHNTLLQMNGIYTEMFESQRSWYK